MISRNKVTDAVQLPKDAVVFEPVTKLESNCNSSDACSCYKLLAYAVKTPYHELQIL